MPSEKLQVILELVTSGYQREAKQAASATDQIGRSAAGVTTSLKGMIGPAAIGGAIVGLGSLALKAGENADRLFDLQAQTGATTDQLQEFEFVAKAAGAEQEFFADAIKQVIKNMDQAVAGTGAVSDAYDRLGISVKDSNGEIRAAGDITAEVIGKLSGMTNITERNALAQDLFGKKWEETVSVLDMGTDQIEALRKEAKDLGVVVSGESLRGADKFRETWEKISATLQGRLAEVLGDMGPTLTEIAEGLLDIVEESKPLFEAIGAITGALDGMREAGDEWSDSANPLIAGFGEFISKVGIMEILTGNYTEAAMAAADVTEQRLSPSLKDVGEKAGAAGKMAEFMASATKDDLIPALSAAVAPIDKVRTAQQKAADATRAHLDGLTALTNRLLASLNPALAAYQALKDLEAAQKAAKDAADEFGSSSEEAAAAQLELGIATAAAEAALLKLGPNATAVIAALADTLNISKDAARGLLIELGLLDGKTFETTHVLHLRTQRSIEALAAGAIPEGLGLTLPTVISPSGGPRAHGGPTRAGEAYLVGERGPEVFVSGQSGSIIPNHLLGGSRTVNITVASPTNNLRQDLQYATILASVQNLVETG